MGGYIQTSKRYRNIFYSTCWWRTTSCEQSGDLRKYTGFVFYKNRNLVPIISIEGDEKVTDARRGKGVYSKLIDSMELMRKKGIIFGVSLTFTKRNIYSLLSTEFIDRLHDYGCKVVFFIEYVPLNVETNAMAPGDKERDLLFIEIENLRKGYSDMIFMSFPGDEKTSGGCLAAGRGFFHINSLDVLDSKLFKSLRDDGILIDEHEGGCVLFEHKEDVEKILKNNCTDK